MPELPEVETIRRHLDATLPGRHIDAVVHLDARMVKRSRLDAAAIARRLTGAHFTRVARAGKFLGLYIGSGGALLLHLGMSGQLILEPSSIVVRPHTHLRIRLADDELRLVDPRRFGRIAWVERLGGRDLRVGIDPLSRRFGGQTLRRLLAGRKVAVKTALMNQTLVAGLGNIYVDEALFLAWLHPMRTAGSLSIDEAARLARAIRKVLRRSLEHRGTSFSDYVDALGHPGANQGYLQVYGRQGLPCVRCKTPIVRIVVGGRSSHICPVCQCQTRPDASGTSGCEEACHAEI